MLTSPSLNFNWQLPRTIPSFKSISCSDINPSNQPCHCLSKRGLTELPTHLNATTLSLPFLTLQFTKPSNHDLEISSPGKFCHKPMHPKMEHFATSTQKTLQSCLKHHACTSHDAKWPVYSCMKTATCNKMANSYNALKPNPKGVHSASHLNRIL